MTRNQAIEIARQRALSTREDHGYLPVTEADAQKWMPHEWVIDAILWATTQCDLAAQQAEPSQTIYCAEKRKPGGCQLHNLHCGWPKCNESSQQAAQPQQAAPCDEEIGWLIEHRAAEHTLWWSGEFCSADGEYRSARLIAKMSNDANNAVRFARKEDAQRVLDAMLAARPSPILARAPELYSVTEHMWTADAQPQQAATGPVEFDHAIGADRYKVVKGSFWWHIRVGDGTANVGKFHTKLAAEDMALKLLIAFRDGAFLQSKAAQPPQD